ncbi:VOC family protein [Sphingopyxis sp. R3-92]|uniref:VOC family protein n=1 Tax=Sphingopyxis sp. R3-92 TaxID=3158553 RepID=UPI003EE6A0B7
MDLIDHMGMGVADLGTSKRFYDAALAPLGIAQAMEVTPEETGGYHGIGYGAAGKPCFWIGNGKPGSAGLHIAFSASLRDEIDAFYNAAMAAGGQDNGPPGIRAHYHPNYYAAFVLDPDGNNVEAVCHAPV